MPLDRGREQDDPGPPSCEPLAGESPQRREPAAAGHGQVEQEQVGRRAAHGRERLVRRRGLAGDDEVGLGLEQPAQAVPEDRVVVGDHHGGGRRLGHAALLGITISMRVPRPGAESSTIDPPSCRTRSLMTSGPRRAASSSSSV